MSDNPPMKTLTVHGQEYVAVAAALEVADLHYDMHGRRAMCGFCPYDPVRHSSTDRRCCEADKILPTDLAFGPVLIPVDLLPILKMRVPPGTLQHS